MTLSAFSEETDLWRPPAPRTAQDVLVSEGLAAAAAELALYEPADAVFAIEHVFAPLAPFLRPDADPAMLRQALLACYAAVVRDVTAGQAFLADQGDREKA